MELSVKINAAIDSFVSAMKQANNEVQKLVSSTGKPVAVNADTTQATKAINGLQSEIKETQSELGKLGGSGALDGLKKSFQEGREQANSGGGIFGGIAGQLGQLVSPMGAATAGIGLLTAGLAASFTLGQEFETNLKSVSAESVIGVFGQMAAAGTLTLKSAANAALGITVDTISKIVMAQAPAILAIFTGTIPPPFGFIAGIAAIGAVQLLLATAKGAIGADQGVIGIDGNYSTPRSSRDTIPIWVRDGESIINPEATERNKALLKFINSTNRPASEFFSNSVVTSNGALQLANSNQIRTSQLVSAGGNSPSSQEFGAMQNSLANIERSLANAKILETRSKHTSAVQLNITENKAYKVQQEKAALRLERARK